MASERSPDTLDVVTAHVPKVATKIEQVARSLAELLGDRPWQASVMMKLADAASAEDWGELETLYASGDIWGGSGSVSDVSFPDPNPTRPVACSWKSS